MDAYDNHRVFAFPLSMLVTMLQDDEAEYTATRFDIAPDTGLLGGKHSYTNRGLSDDTHKYTSAGRTKSQHACEKSIQNAAAAQLLGIGLLHLRVGRIQSAVA